MTKVCVFTGAGIGAPIGLPTTSGFVPTINKIEDALLKQIKSFLKDSDVNDIEQILYLLEDFVRERDFASHIVRQGLNNSSFQNVNNNLSQYKLWARNAIELIKAEIYTILTKYDRDKVSKLYTSIIKEIKEEFENCSFSFFTTNYDMAFENGFAKFNNHKNLVGIKDVYYGFGGGSNGRQEYNPSEDFDWNPEIIEYMKLHGSLDWTMDDGACIKTGAALNPKDPSIMPMLYPGFKGTPVEQPFIDLHEKLDRRLSEAEILIVIGFAFRDDYINNIIDYSLKRNKNLFTLCYNPLKLSELPADSRVKDFAKKYSNTFRYVQTGVDMSESPLKLRETLKKVESSRFLAQIRDSKKNSDLLI